MNKVLETDGANSCTAMWMISTPWKRSMQKGFRCWKLNRAHNLDHLSVSFATFSSPYSVKHSLRHLYIFTVRTFVIFPHHFHGKPGKKEVSVKSFTSTCLTGFLILVWQRWACCQSSTGLAGSQTYCLYRRLLKDPSSPVIQMQIQGTVSWIGCSLLALFRMFCLFLSTRSLLSTCTHCAWKVWGK